MPDYPQVGEADYPFSVMFVGTKDRTISKTIISTITRMLHNHKTNLPSYLQPNIQEQTQSMYPYPPPSKDLYSVSAVMVF